MSDRAAGRLAWGLASVAIAFTLASAVLLAFNGLAMLGSFRPHEIIVGTVYAATGALIAARNPRNAVGWVLIAGSLFWTTSLFGEQYGWFAGILHPGALPGAGFAAWLQSWVWQPGTALMLVYLPLLFPDGRFRSRRWRAFGIVVAVATMLAVSGAGGAYWPLRGDIRLMVVGNTDATTMGGMFAVLANATIVVMLGPLVAAAGSILRFRDSRGDERQQMKWFALAFAVMAVSIVVDQFVPPRIQGLPSLVGIIVLPIAVAVAILKYRLYEIDVVINKTVVYAGLAAFITIVYVAIVVGVGALLGSGDRTNVPLSIAATAIVALAFQPVRERVQRLANRLVYGERATPYEVLSRFSERLSGTFATEDLLPRMAHILAEGTGAERADVWLLVGDTLRVDASWPPGMEPRPPIDAAKIPDELVPVHHQDRLLGALSIDKGSSERLTPAETKLVNDLASQVGLVLRNAALTEELRARLEDLRASRQRIVAAQDQERRRLERDIHDGAQQQIVALSVKLRLAERFAPRDTTKAHELLAELQTDAGEALENLRDLARGVYPPLLADRGLVAALESQARRSPVSVNVSGNGVGRYRAESEAAVYFCCLEALQNVAKHANASHAEIGLSDGDGRLTFTVSDDGGGFDPERTGHGTGLQGMADRLAALGGALQIASSPGEGTSVGGDLPIAAMGAVS